MSSRLLQHTKGLGIRRQKPHCFKGGEGGCQKSHGLDTLHLGNSCGVHQQSSPMSLRAPVH